MSSNDDPFIASRPEPDYSLESDPEYSIESDPDHFLESDTDYSPESDQDEFDTENRGMAPWAAEEESEAEDLEPESLQQPLGCDLLGVPLPSLPPAGRQSIATEKVHPQYVLSASRENLVKIMEQPLRDMVANDENKGYLKIGAEHREAFVKESRDRMECFLQPKLDDDDSVEEGYGLRCAYSDMWCILAGEGPMSPSIEAQHPFGVWTQPDGERRVVYHCPFTGPDDRENMRVVASGLNWLHFHYPVAVLPALGMLFRAADTPDLAQRSQLIELGATMLINLGVLAAITYNTPPHRHRHPWYESLEAEEAEAVTELSRNPVRSAYVDDRLSLFSRKEIFRFRPFERCQATSRSSPSAAECSEIYEWCWQIASSHRLTLEEFEQLCYIEKTPSARPKGFVPFFFSHLSKQEAQDQGWSWTSYRAFFKWKLKRLIEDYRKDSSDKGYLVEETWTSLLLTVAHRWCYMVKKAKDMLPVDADIDQIRWHVLDSCGLPVVWWNGCALSSSVNKRLHGVVISFGWKDRRPGDKQFDPVADFDQESSNISWDASATNMAELDASQHRKVWKPALLEVRRTYGTNIRQVLARPAKSFAWHVESKEQVERSSDRSHIATGLFVHGPRVDQQFWEADYGSCNGCGQVFARKSNLKSHEAICKVLNPDGPAKPYRCDGCGRGFARKSHLESHKAICKGPSERQRALETSNGRREHEKSRAKQSTTPVKAKQKRQRVGSTASIATYSDTTIESPPRKRPQQTTPAKLSTTSTTSTKLDASCGDGGDGSLCAHPGSVEDGASYAHLSTATLFEALPVFSHASLGFSGPPSLLYGNLEEFPWRNVVHNIGVPATDRPDWLSSVDEVAPMFADLHYEGSAEDLGTNAVSRQQNWLQLILGRYNLEGRLARGEYLWQDDLSAELPEIFRDVPPEHMVYEEYPGSMLSDSVNFDHLWGTSARFSRQDHANAGAAAFAVHAEGNHWFLAVYEDASQTIYIADSMRVDEDSQRYQDVLGQVREYLTDLGRWRPHLSLELLDVPAQEDSASCALHVLSNLGRLLRGGAHHPRIGETIWSVWRRRVENQLGQSSPTRPAPPERQRQYDGWLAPADLCPEKPSDDGEPAAATGEPAQPVKLKQTGLSFGGTPLAPKAAQKGAASGRSERGGGRK
ncbi:hypothetical protein LQW54_006362 [Pestalotiopsis sp. IQ-011]